MSSKSQLKSSDGGSLPERRKHGFAVKFFCGEPSVENQWGEGGEKKVNHSCVW